MPQVVAALTPIAVNLAIGLGGALISNWLRPPQQQTRSTQASWQGVKFQVAVGEAVPVSAIVGRGRTAGHLIFAQEYGANNEFLKLVIKIGHGWHDAMELALAEEKPLTLSGSNDDVDGRVVEQYRIDAAGAPSPTGTPHMWMKAYDGRPGQDADPGLIAASGGSSRWGALHKMTGCAYIVVTLRYNATLFPSASLPRFGFVWRGLRQYDWRKDSTMPGGAGAHRWSDPATWQWTENPAVIAWNFRRGFWIGGVKVLGFGFSAWSNDLAYFTSAANIADEPIYYPETNATMARYAYGREISDDEDRLSVQREIEASWCGSSFDRGGAYAPLPAAQQIPIMTLSMGRRIEATPTRADKFGAVSAKKTAWHGTFMSQADYWVPTPFEQRINVSLEALLGGRKPVPFDQPFEHRQERAQGRAETNLRRALYPATVTATFGPEAKMLEAGDPVTLDHPEWGPTMMIVESTAASADDLGRVLSLSQWNNAIVPASGEAFVAIPPGPGAGPADPDRTILVPAFDAIAFSRTGGGAVHPFGKASWAHISDPNVDQVLIRVWPAAGDEAVDGETFFANPRLQDTKLFGPLQPETPYLAKSIPLRKDGRLTFWSAAKAFTTGAETVPLEPGSVGPEHMVRDLRALPMLVDQLAEGVSGLEARLGALAMVVANNTLLTQQLVSGISVRNAGAMAAVVRVEKVTVEQKAALATLSEDVAVSIGNLSAGGTLRMESHVDELTGVSTVMFKVKATNGEFTAQSALQIGASVTVDGAVAWAAVTANAFYFHDNTGAFVTRPFFISAGITYAESLRFLELKSVDGETVHIDGVTGDYSFG